MGYPLYCDAIKKTCEAKVSSTQTSICTPLFGANAEYIAEPMLHKKCRQLEESGVSGKDLCEQIVGYAAKTDTVYGERICTWDLRELH